MTDTDDVAGIEIAGTLDRAERSRAALRTAIARIPDARFGVDAPEEWSVARLLRHVVWVEYLWSMFIEHARDAAQTIVDIDAATNLSLAKAASRRAGTPEERVPAPPPYADPPEARACMDDSRRYFDAALRSLDAAALSRRMSTSRGVITVRFAIEHIIEHDWDHAVQITAIGA